MMAVETSEILILQGLSDLRDGLDPVPMIEAALMALREDTGDSERADLDDLAADLDVSHLA